ncbi:MAG: hypothetical protein GYA14_14570, partial [Ignavibacteria bacterium]|nr:hypothetical protein [Ignavibacteria bacterium]
WTGEHFARFIEVYYSEKPDLRLCKPTACVLYSFNEKPPVSLDAKNLVTINLPTTPADLPEGGSDKPIEDINKSFGAGVGFGIADSNFNVTKTHCWTRWNWFSDTKNPEGYSWVNNGANVDEIPEFNYIIFKKIPAYNMSGNNTKIKVSIYSGNDETKLLSSKFLKDCSGISTYLSNDVYNDTYKTIYENTSQLVKEFKNELKKESNISDNYTIQVAVTDSDGNVILDKFILHFKYRKLVVMPSGGSIYTPGSTVNFIAKVGSEDIMSNKLSWTCESSGNLLSFSEPGKLNIKQGASGIIKVKGIVNDIGSIHYGKEAEFEFSVQAKLNIIPERNPINIFEKTTLTASLGDVPTDASWSIVDATGNVIDYSVNGSCGTLALASNLPAAPKANAAEIRSSKCIYTAPDKPGEYRITATASNGMAELTITVVEPAKGFHIEIDPPVQNATVPEIEYGRHRLVAKIDAVPYDVSGWDVKCLVHNQWHNFGPGRYGYDKSHIVIIPMMPEDSTCRYDEYDVIAHIDATDKQPYREAKIKVKIKDFNPDNGPIDPISNPGNIAEVKVYPDSSIIYNGEKQKLTAVITGVDMSKISNKQWYIEEWYPGANMGTINSNGNECVYTPPDNDLGYNRTIYFKFTLDGKEYKASSAITVSRLKLELNGTSFNIGNGETIKIRASLNDNINVPIMWSNNNTECGSVIAESNGNITTENGYTKIYGVGSYTAKILKSYPGQDIITATAVYQGHTITATANIAVNEIKISVPKKVVALAGKGYINNLNNYVSIEGANNTNLNFMVGTVEIEDGSQYKTDNFSEPYYDDYEKSMLTIISLANGTTMTTEIIIARPVLKEVKQYYDDGRLLLYYKAVVNIDLNNYNNSEFTGTFKEYVMYNHGFYKRYNANGALIEECIYTTGLLNGLYQEYYDNGDLKIKCVYVNNTLNGPYEKYDGEKMTRGRIGEYINNLAENTWTVTSTNGRKWWEGKYVQNLREGKWTNWYDNESHQVQAEVEYANDKKNGTYTEWYDNEKHSIWRQGQYVNDVQTGIWKEWDYN